MLLLPPPAQRTVPPGRSSQKKHGSFNLRALELPPSAEEIGMVRGEKNQSRQLTAYEPAVAFLLLAVHFNAQPCTLVPLPQAVAPSPALSAFLVRGRRRLS